MEFIEGRLFKATITLLFLFLLISILIIGKSFLIPLACAAIIALAGIRILEVFFFIIVGGIIWGIAGMVLFLPIVGIVKIFLESNPKTAHYAIFLSDTKYKISNYEDEDE